MPPPSNGPYILQTSPVSGDNHIDALEERRWIVKAKRASSNSGFVDF